MKLLNTAASVITLIGFFFSLTQISVLDKIEVDISPDVSPITGSWFIALILTLIVAIIFGYGFGRLVAFFENKYGRMMLISATPLSGLVSGFQTGAITLLIANSFGIEAGLTAILLLSYLISGILETMFVYRSFKNYFPIREDGTPRYSNSTASINILFFVFGGLAFGADSKFILDTGTLVVLLLVGVVFAIVALIAGEGLFSLTNEADN